MSNDSKQNLYKFIKQAALKQELERLQPNFINIDEFYKDALIRWYYHTSDIKKAIAELKFSETEQSKVITENDFCKTKDGFQLTESDFIKVELKRFEIIEPDKLSLIENKRFEFYNDFLLNRLEQPQQTQTLKPIKTLNDFFINIDEDNKENFYNELKEIFPTEIGKSIKVIIDELAVQNMLVIGAREFKAFHAELGKTFNRDIGTYQSIQNIKNIHKVSSEPIKIKLNSLIIKYKSN